MANTRKTAAKFGGMIDNEPRSPTNLDSNAMDKMLMSHLISLQETINKQGEEIRTLMKENTKLQSVVIENESLKQVVAKLQEEIQECKRASFETNERLNKIELKEALKEEKLDTMRRDVSEMKNVCTTKSWADVCGGDVLSNSSNMHVMHQEKNIENIDVRELKERERRSKNIVIRGIKEESIETPASLGKAIGEFFSMHYGMSDVNVYGAHRVGKHGVTRSGERPIVCTMTDDTKRRIILENSWVYLKGTQCFVSEDRTISQQNARRKAYEERLKNKVKDVPKDGNVGK